jgi:hypothetical protein
VTRLIDLPAQLVANTLSLTLESLALISSRLVDSEESAPSEAMLVRLLLSEDELVVLELVAGREFAQLVAANLLRTSPEDLENQPPFMEALKELIVAAGGALLGLTLDYDAESPRMGKLTVKPFPAGRNWHEFVGSRGASVFDAGGNTIAIRMRAIGAD